MIRIKRNPHLEDIEEFIKSNSIKFEYLAKGREGSVFYFKLDKRLILNTEILQSGEYVLKVLNEKKYYSLYDIRKLETFSKLGLIPKIHVITKNYSVMKYIKGITLEEFFEDPKYSGYFTREEFKIINDKINNLYNIWGKFNFKKYIDQNKENILISDKLNVYIIDPFLN